MSDVWTRLARIVRTNECAALVTVLDVRGSAPREAGTRMIVAADGSFSGTIGGGQLEWEAIQLAAGRLGAGASSLCLTKFALGPDLGQCCGGRIDIAVEIFNTADLPDIEQFSGLEASGGFSCETRFDVAGRHANRLISGKTSDIEDMIGAPSAGRPSITIIDPANQVHLEWFAFHRQPVLLFGAGHVSRALVLALAPLPFRVTWVDSRPNAFPKAMPQNVSAIHSQRPAGQIEEVTASSFVIIMTHSHPLDLELCRTALAHSGLPYVGVIGSNTKRARFEKRLRDSGLDSLTVARLRCPIGIDGIDDKAPPVIAASVAAELLHAKQELSVVNSISIDEFHRENANQSE